MLIVWTGPDSFSDSSPRCLPGCIGLMRECQSTYIRFCSECGGFPCEGVKKLEKRYVAKYRTSLIDNLLQIQDKGLSQWLAEEEQKWRCPQCSGTISMHDGTCYDCGHNEWGT